MMYYTDDEIKVKIILTIIIAMEMLQYRLLAHFIVKKNIRYPWMEPLFLAGYGIALWMERIDLNWYSTTLHMLLFIMYLVKIESSMKQKLVNAVKILLCSMIMEFYIEGMLTICIDESYWVTDGLSYLFCNVCFLVLLVMGIVFQNCFSLIKEQSRQKAVNVGVYISISILAVSIPFSLYGSEYAILITDSNMRAGFLRFFSLMSFISFLGLIGFMLYMKYTNQKMKEYLGREHFMQKMQKEYYEAMLQKELDTKRFRHDISNHLICLRELIQMGNLPEADSYICQLQGGISDIIKTNYMVGNDVLNAVLNSQLRNASEFCVSVTGGCTDEIHISDVDLCTITANLIQNAKEELLRNKDEKGVLQIVIMQKQRHVVIQVKNSSAPKQIGKKTKLPKTTKQDSEYHGMGLKNVKEAVERNQGDFRCEWEDGMFTATVILACS